MPMGFLMAGGAILGAVGASQQASAAERAAEMQNQAAMQGMQQQREMFDILNAQQAPYRQAGYGALTRIQDMLPSLTSQVTEQDLMNMPGVRFALEQGKGVTGQQLNTLGGGSNIARAQQKFATDYTMQQALPAYLSQRKDIYNTLAGIAGIGQTAQQQQQALGTSTANALSQLGIGGAGAMAAGQIGGANALAGGLQGIGNAGLMYGLLRPQSSSAASTAGFGTDSGGFYSGPGQYGWQGMSMSE